MAGPGHRKRIRDRVHTGQVKRVRRPSLLLGAFLGGLIILPLIASAYVGKQWAGLPFHHRRNVQVESPRDPYPNGATGYHSVTKTLY